MLDGIGAISLVLGLFRAPIVHTFGGSRPSPSELAADDRAYGVVGGAFLVVGFALQEVGTITDASASTSAEAIAAGVTSAVGVPVAVLAWRTLRSMFRRRLGAR